MTQHMLSTLTVMLLHGIAFHTCFSFSDCLREKNCGWTPNQMCSFFTWKKMWQMRNRSQKRETKATIFCPMHVSRCQKRKMISLWLSRACCISNSEHKTFESDMNFHIALDILIINWLETDSAPFCLFCSRLAEDLNPMSSSMSQSARTPSC